MKKLLINKLVPLFLKEGEGEILLPLRANPPVSPFNKGGISVIARLATGILTKSLFLFFTALLFCGNAAAQPSYKQISCVIHVHSNFSEGNNKSIDEIAAEAKASGIDALITADKDLLQWEYGLWPLRNLIKKTIRQRSVLSSDPYKYLSAIRNAEQLNPGLIIIPGMESAPFYYWSGSPFNNDLSMLGWHKHLLIAGLEDPEAYMNIPVVSNEWAGSFSLLTLWPLIFLIPAFVFRRSKVVFFVFLAACLVTLADNYPFRAYPFNQYNGQQGEKPYQNLINYVQNKGGLIYWAHPESPNNEIPQKMGMVNCSTSKYAESLLTTTGYTGFAIFSEGYKEAGCLGGYWDRALMEYCLGKREKPVWAIGEVDYGENSFRLDIIRNILYVTDITKTSVLEALRNGNCHVLWRAATWELTMNKFKISSGKNEAVCGQEIVYDGPVRIHNSIATSDDVQRPIKIYMVKNGALLKTIEITTPAMFVFEDTAPLRDGMNYYRIFIDAGYANYIATNPVFVKK